MNPVKVDQFDFGQLEYYSCFVIGKIDPNVVVDDNVAKVLLNSSKKYFGKNKYVYISDREIGHNVDLSVYKYVDAKRVIGIAIVSSHREELIVSAGKEQAAYSGSFGVFNTMDSAISWAESLVEGQDQ
ncbi:hypothetical protein [Nonlabens marinus]|uniref:Thymidylate synthase n=1 Tax=Nonlabens marinus S1-08 TaxID=1454201 RepID=W8VW74_9FLAO|nr:hypothetical protein [Nonlabens marinus]BAO54502.1 hypothetical protein NMS_0493 [Nonlabens marinus S1-08]